MKTVDADAILARAIPASVRAELDTSNVQPDAPVRFIAVDRDDAGRLDAMAGCEFVDDRIRLQE
jgi:hypothetical protein